ncbi:group III truncated hemoglobin [Chelatococcus sp. SYSU_G07232]|uniref:Group III truncated hemoglobin n=1 Tax=Chelatococcus albus TaxID=3047466 RepID=A0ABT7AHZ2_9HYPH|nr:group III truncated hemoglobin [Chelatococcus sp. SYSU_G07232]MDJ1158997.1 group III truncated hemoglobin [Chelatococcus sp. SYSU_G07232]
MSTSPPSLPNPQAREDAPGAAAGIDEAMIRALVHAFYERVRRDAVLGPIFERAVDDWPAHLVQLRDFWSSVVLFTRRYDGRPVPAHARHPDISGEHFVRWLALFRQTAEELCPPEAAALFVSRAERIARSLQGALAHVRDGLGSPFGAPRAAGPGSLPTPGGPS